MKHPPVFMNACSCGHVDWNFIYLHVKAVNYYINTYYPGGGLNSSYYMFNDKTTAALMPLEYSTFDIFCP